MAKKKSIISDRLGQMYYFGTESHELSRCLLECKQRLTRNGAKADNLPRGPEKGYIFSVRYHLKPNLLCLIGFVKI